MNEMSICAIYEDSKSIEQFANFIIMALDNTHTITVIRILE